MALGPEARLIGEALAQVAQAAPDRRGYLAGGVPISFGEMDQAADRFAAALLRLGLGRGDRLAINALNQPEWLTAYLGAARIGVTTVGLNVRYRDVELEYILNQSETRAVLSVGRLRQLDYRAFFASLAPRLPSVRDYIFLDGEEEVAAGPGRPAVHRFGPLCEGPVDGAELLQARARVSPADPVMIIYTSGTTGRPKGAVLTHQSQLAAARGQAAHLKVVPDDVLLLALPFNHVGGITCGAITMLLGGACSLLLPSFSPDEALRLLAAHRPTIWAAVPTMHTLLLAQPGAAALDASRLRLVITGGSNADPGLLSRIGRAFPAATVMNLYGLSESSGAVVMSPWGCDPDRLLRSIGRPLAGVELQIVDEHGQAVGEGRIGELLVRGAAVGAGYFRMAEESRATFDEQGWLHTGDLGYRDGSGDVVLMGRLKEMYIQGGFNIYPVEVENLIARHPAVAMVAGFGVPDEVLGEVGRYYLIPRPGVPAPTEEEILAFCREHLADYKVPRRVVVRADLPLTPAGKIMKSRLRDEALGGD